MRQRRSIVVAAFALATIVSVTSSVAQQIPARGFTAILCQLGVNGSGTYCAPGGTQFCVDVQDQAAGENAGGTRTASVTVHHGQTSSDHVVTYTDDGSGSLDCGDIVLSVQ